MNKKNREFCIVANTAREGITEAVISVAKICVAHDIGLRIVEQEEAYKKVAHNELDLPALMELSRSKARINVVPVDENSAKGCELVIVFGGDGTFLRAAEYARHASIPIYGVNLGHVGFMAEVEVNLINSVIEDLISGNYHVDKRMTIDVSVIDQNGNEISSGWALNEASIENRSRQGLLELVTEVDSRPVTAFACDGILVSTPTGSTAYAFSAGGPIIWPDVEAILIIPNNAHALFTRPLVVSPKATIAVEIESTGLDSIVFCDGRRILAVPAGSRVEIKRGNIFVGFAKTDNRPFADRLVKRFKLPVSGWRGVKSSVKQKKKSKKD